MQVLEIKDYEILPLSLVLNEEIFSSLGSSWSDWYFWFCLGPLNILR